MTVNILIGGLAVCYNKDNFWNVVFICDKDHPVNFKQDGTGDDPERLHQDKMDADISFDLGGSSISAPQKGGNFGSIFNMAADYAHKKNNLRLSQISRKTNALAMRVPSAELGTHLLTDRDYWVQDIGEGTTVGNPVELIGRVAHILVAKLEIDRKMTMSVKYKANEGAAAPLAAPIPPPFEKTFEFVDNKEITLVFDNDCQGCIRNDFVDLYDWVKHVDKGKEKKFVAGKVKDELLNGQRRVHPNKSEETSSAKKILSALHGNCDPVVIEPPPGN